MENQILVECFVPSINRSYDAILPLDKTIHDVLELLSKSICELSGGLFIVDNSILCERQNGKVLNINLTVKEQGLTNGSKLMLI